MLIEIHLVPQRFAVPSITPVRAERVVSYREIRGATKQLGQKMSTKELKAFFSVADTNNDRKISKEELAGVLASYTHASGSSL